MRLSLCCLTLLLAACAALMPRPQFLRPTAEAGVTHSVVQRLQIERGDQRWSLDALVEIDREAMQIAVLAGGRRMLSIRADGAQVVDVRAPGVPEMLESREIVSALQLVHWPIDSLRRALPEGWTLEETPRLRRLLQGDILVAEVRYSQAETWQGRAILIDHQHALRMTIDSQLQ